MDPQVLARLTARQTEVASGQDSVLTGPDHAGVGLQNISERLDSLFGDRYDLSISTPRSGGTVVDLTIPLR